jgi:hypothetical protein
MSREAMQVALEALDSDNPDIQLRAAIALRQALETEQEPVAWMHNFIEGNVITHIPADIGHHPERWTPLYTTPPKREWVGLTDDAVFELADTNLYDGGKNYGVLAFAKAIEQALKEKNQ